MVGGFFQGYCGVLFREKFLGIFIVISNVPISATEIFGILPGKSYPLNANSLPPAPPPYNYDLESIRFKSTYCVVVSNPYFSTNSLWL